ncbi:type II toxin-antitoxin system VapC family toxin [Vineibacter terrae]|uniref:type II toxin-antitoxin system VapC family toxin n=1 Tax=Vineibacter terrae TaxID=2586908 RepID=UPI002E34C700|nr:type II toxin-antitoxin system VapC family toxin [Vineibacter terrae]HEX2885819.1 type II toxin-antitoxin system VapC family toxin [Vineibacter terrae]
MRLLLDTHVFLWAMEGGGRLRPAAIELITDSSNDLFLSVISVWEIGIKTAIGKLRAPGDIESGMRALGAAPVAMELPHALQAARLPLHHRDPFDRLIVAQAIVEQMPLVTRDHVLARYGVSIIAA